MKAILLLEDGTIFEGQSFGKTGEKIGEVVFHTGVVGYQEIITDPAYRGQLVTMAYPLIGNYGINEESYESEKAQASALIVKENSKIYSNWLAKGSLEDFMKNQGVVGIEGIDTRALVIHIRDKGEMKGIISTEDFNKESLLKKIKSSSPKGSTKKGAISKILEWGSRGGKYNLVVIDLGTNFSLLKTLKASGCKITRVPATTSAKEILSLNPDGILLSSGPGNPNDFSEVISEVKELIGKKPLFGVSLGCLVLGLALGGKVKRMKVGHHGVNQPVKEVLSDKAEITNQNHSFVLEASGSDSDIEITHINLNDQSVEGIKSKNYPVVGWQYFPASFEGRLNA